MPLKVTNEFKSKVLLPLSLFNEMSFNPFMTRNIPTNVVWIYGTNEVNMFRQIWMNKFKLSFIHICYSLTVIIQATFRASYIKA